MESLRRASVIGWLAMAGCSASAPTGNGSGDTGVVTDVVVPPDVADGAVATDVPATTDVPAATDVPVTTDVPAATDVPAPTDVPVATDVPSVDDAAVDVPVAPDVPASPDVPLAPDVPVVVDAPAPSDVPSADPCASPVNLNLAGTLSGNTLRYTGNNSSTPAATSYTSCGRLGHVLAFAYTPRTSTILRVSTDNAGTLAAFDTIAFAQDRCVAAGATSLGCNDDLGSPTRTRASTFVTPRVTAGTTVFLFVGGFDPPVTAEFTSVGAFELTVSEAPIVPAGSTCDPAGVTSACAVGSSCRIVGRSTYCVVDGAADGACRAAAPRCDGALTCDGSGFCQAASGANGGPCRTSGTPCDTGLACSSTTLRCRAAVADGGACDALGATSACVAPSQCGGGVCRRWWVESALPAPAFVDACTIGTHVMLNGTSRDDARSAAAVVIPWSFSYFGTTQTQFWPSTNGFIQFGATPPSNATGGRGAIPDARQGPMVALYWTDLVLRPAASDICVATVGTAPDRRSVVEWLDAYRYGSAESHLTMELVLNERGGAIDLIYSRLEAPAGASTVVDGSNATIGLQSGAGELFVTHAGTVSTAAGVRFTPVP